MLFHVVERKWWYLRKTVGNMDDVSRIGG